MRADAMAGPARRIPPVPTGFAADVGELEVISAPGSSPVATDEGFVPILVDIIKRNIRNLPRFLAKNGLWVGPLAVIWALLHAVPNGTLSRMPAPIPALASLVIFLTATYNGFIAKATFIGLINGLVLPFAGEIKAMGGMAAIQTRLSKYAQAIGVVRRAYRGLGAAAPRMMLMSVGAGLVLANVLSRNNKVDKYLVSLMAAVGLINALSRGLGDPVVRLFSALWRDVARASGKKAVGPDLGRAFAALAGVAAGLAGSLVFAFVNFTNSFYDPSGYIVGGVCLVAGIAWSLAGGTNVGNRAQG